MKMEKKRMNISIKLYDIEKKMNKLKTIFILLIFINTGCNNNKVKLYPNGNIEIEIHNDTCYWYYPNGEIEEKFVYINNKREGISYSFFPNGDTAIIQSYKNNLLDGRFISFYENGNRRVTSTYVKDKEEGVGYYFHENGNIASITNVKMGTRIDSQYRYDESGRLQSKFYVDNEGKITETTFFDSVGNITEVINNQDIIMPDSAYLK